jgi:carbamoyl-phosphate synthase large subunit
MNKQIDLIISTPKPKDYGKLEDTYTIRRLAVDFSIPLINNLQIATLFIDAISKKKIEDLSVKAWDEY